MTAAAPIHDTATLTDSRFHIGATLVAGGSGGIGQAICRAFAKAGSDVALTYLKNAGAAADVAADVGALGRRAACIQMDLCRPDQVRDVVETVRHAFGAIHTVVYASGPYMDFGRVADTDPAEWKRVIETDVVGYFNLLHAAIPALRETGGTIVALTSAGTRRYPPGDILSAGAKASVEMLTRATAREEGRHGIRANCIGVGWIEAGLGLSVQDKPGVPAMVERFIRGTPLRRMGRAEEVAAVAVFLASQAASYVSGNLVCVDGAGHV